MTEHLYRVAIIAQPEWEERLCFRTHVDYDTGEETTTTSWEYCPVEWEPAEDYIEHFKSDRWIAPALDKAWRSRSSAASRRDLLNAAGYLAIVQRSAPIEWPEGEQEKVNNSDGKQIAAAIKTLKKNGLIKSADELFGGRP